MRTIRTQIAALKRNLRRMDEDRGRPEMLLSAGVIDKEVAAKITRATEELRQIALARLRALESALKQKG